MGTVLSLGESKETVTQKDERGCRETRKAQVHLLASDLAPQSFAQHTHDHSPHLGV
jgi:hypothetical protein